MKKLITSKNHISQYFPLGLKFRVFPRMVFPGNYHWYFPTNPARRKNQWYIVSQLLLVQNIWQAWSQVFLPTTLSGLIKNIILHQSKIYKNHFDNSNFWGMWPLGHVGNVTYSLKIMLFISTGFFDDKFCPQILSVVATANAPLK